MANPLKNSFLKTYGFYINSLSYIYPKKAVRLSEKLISEPKKGKLDPVDLPQILQNSHRVRIVSDKFSIQTYTWKGVSDKIILLVHGWESNASRWSPLIAVLKKSGYTIMALDAPAHGLSDNEWFNVAKYSEAITEVIEHHNPEIVIGHSIGGTASVFHQFKHHTPSIKKMVLMGSPSELITTVKKFAYLLGLNKKVIRLMDKKFEKDYGLSFKRFSVSQMVKSIEAEGLLIHDRNDIVVKIRESRSIKSAWKQSKMIQTKGLGHGLQNDDLYLKIYDFLFN